MMQNDANEQNVLVDETRARVTGIIDFGDCLHTCLIFELVPISRTRLHTTLHCSTPQASQMLVACVTDARRVALASGARYGIQTCEADTRAMQTHGRGTYG